DLAHREHLPGTAALAADHDALVDLDALLVALRDPYVDTHGVARPEVRDIGAQIFLLDLLQLDHGAVPLLDVAVQPEPRERRLSFESSAGASAAASAASAAAARSRSSSRRSSASSCAEASRS